MANNKYQELLNNATKCIITIEGIKDPALMTVVKRYKASAWEFAKACYLLNKVQGIKLDAISEKIEVDTATIGKHAVNVAWLLERYGKGFDEVAELYSISKVDMLRKACDAGAFKKTAFEDAIKKTRKEIETAMKRAKSGKPEEADTETSEEVKMYSIRMINPETGEEITRAIDADTWKQWVEEA